MPILLFEIGDKFKIVADPPIELGLKTVDSVRYQESTNELKKGETVVVCQITIAQILGETVFGYLYKSAGGYSKCIPIDGGYAEIVRDYKVGQKYEDGVGNTYLIEAILGNNIPHYLNEDQKLTILPVNKVKMIVEKPYKFHPGQWVELIDERSLGNSTLSSRRMNIGEKFQLHRVNESGNLGYKTYDDNINLVDPRCVKPCDPPNTEIDKVDSVATESVTIPEVSPKPVNRFLPVVLSTIVLAGVIKMQNSAFFNDPEIQKITIQLFKAICWFVMGLMGFAGTVKLGRQAGETKRWISNERYQNKERASTFAFNEEKRKIELDALRMNALSKSRNA